MYSDEEKIEVLKDCIKKLDEMTTELCEFTTVKHSDLKNNLDFHLGQAWYNAFQLLRELEKEDSDVA